MRKPIDRQQTERPRVRSIHYSFVAAMSILVLIAACQTTDEAPPEGEASTSEEGEESATEDAGTEDAGEGGTLVYVQAEDIHNFDPTQTPFGNVVLHYQLFDSLIELDADDEPQPALATDWSLSDDGLAITFQLREDVEFHDGEPFTAEHVAYNVERYQNPDVAAQMRGVIEWIDDVEVTGNHELVLHFDEPRPAIWHGLSQLFITQEGTEEEILSTPVGTGPFMLENYSPGNEARFVPNEAYWRDGPHVDELIVRIVPDAQAAAISLETGEAHIYSGPSWQDLERLEAVDGVEATLSDRAPWMQDLMLNTRREPLDDPRVRQAIHHAVDRDRVVQIAYSGFSEPWCLPWHEASAAFDDELARNCPQDLDRARELLADAGYEDGFTIEITVWDGGINVVGRDLANILREDLAEIGIDLEIAVFEPGEARTRLFDHNFDLFAHTVASVWADPSILFDGSALWSPDPDRNMSGYADEEFTSLVEEASTTLDDEARRDIFDQINRDHMVENVWVLGIARYDAAFAHSDAISGLEVGLAAQPILRDVRLAE